MRDEPGISIPFLKQVCALLLDHLAEVEGDEVVLGADYFWSIPRGQLYNVYEKPGELTIGQLTECLSNLERLVEDPSEITSYSLVWLAELLRSIGHKVVR